MRNFAENCSEMKRILLIMMLFAAVAAAAQSARPIRWRLSVKMTSETEGTATVRALVGDGWHLYGFEMPDGGPRPTVISLGESAAVEAAGAATPSAAPLKVFDPMFDCELEWWASTVAFEIPFRITGPDPVLKVSVSYMGCDNTTCLPPQTETLVYKAFGE